jgi:hypothetical protein
MLRWVLPKPVAPTRTSARPWVMKLVEVAQEDLAIELGAEAEVEVVEGFLEGEAGVLQPAAQLILLASEQLLL